jgi:hypothetical protein
MITRWGVAHTPVTIGISELSKACKGLTVQDGLHICEKDSVGAAKSANKSCQCRPSHGSFSVQAAEGTEAVRKGEHCM